MEQVAGALIFLLLGLTAPALAALREFHFVNQSKNWTEAQSYCRDKFTDLATIQNQVDWTTVSQMVGNSGHPWAWLGLYDDVESWRWSLDNTSLYSRDLGSWFDFTEENANGNEHCVATKNGLLNDVNCETVITSVCYDEPSNTYVPVTDTMSWQSAQTLCRETYTDLASIRDQQELNAVVNVTQTDVTYWIGLSREGWKWSDQSHSSFRFWASHEPGGYGYDCALTGVDDWIDNPCSSSFPFICSATIRPSKVLKVRVKTDALVNVNDPLVQEAILKQMEKDLRGQGLTLELSLSWRKQPHGLVFNRTEL